MRTAIAGACALALAGCADLPPETVREETAYQVLAAADAAQTLQIADNPNRFAEQNPALGSHPQPAKVAAWFALGGVTHYGVTALLVDHDAPGWLVHAWEVSGIALEAVCIGNNVGNGVAPTLSFHINTSTPAAHVARH